MNHNSVKTNRDETVSCLSAEEMMGYAEGTLSTKSRLRVESHLHACDLCSEAMAGLSAYSHKEKFMPVVEVLNREIRQNAASSRPESKPLIFRNWSFYIPIAAVLVIGFVALYFGTRPTKSEQLFAEYFAPYPNIIMPVTRSDQAVGGQGKSEQPLEIDQDNSAPGEIALANALLVYEKRDYRGALALFMDLPEDPAIEKIASLYEGISFLALGQSHSAIDRLQQSIAATEPTPDPEAAIKDRELHEIAQWYLGLAYLKDGEPDKARKILAQIVNNDGLFKRPAEEALARLD